MVKFYEYSVMLDENSVRVVAQDRLSASKKGAKELGVVWRERARDLVIIQGREIRRTELEKAGLQAAAPAKMTKYKPTTKRRSAGRK